MENRSSDAEEILSSPPAMTEEVFSTICLHFFETATWPLYRRLEIAFRRIAPVEVAIQALYPETVRVIGDRDDAEVRIASLTALTRCALFQDDVDRFVTAARLFAERSIQGPDQEVSITGIELKDALHLSDLETLRLCRLIDDLGPSLERGGGRGPKLEQWYFIISSEAMYFEDVRSLADYERQRIVATTVRELRLARGRSWGFYARAADQPRFAPIQTTNFPANAWQIHPAVATASASLFASEHYSEAVRAAMQRFEAYLQDRLADFETSGFKLVSKALNAKSPVIRLSDGATARERDEQEGYFHLAAGAMFAFRNFHSHGMAVEITHEEALERLAVISTLFRRIDVATA